MLVGRVPTSATAERPLARAPRGAGPRGEKLFFVMTFGRRGRVPNPAITDHGDADKSA